MYGWLIYDDAGSERNGWFIERLLSYAASCCVELRLVRSKEIQPGIKNGKRVLLRDKARLPDFAVVRTIAPLLSETLEECGVSVFNNARCSRVFNDKRYTHKELASLDIPMAESYFVYKSGFDPSFYNYPIVIKAPMGHGGKEVFAAYSANDAERIVSSLSLDGFLVQELVDEGKDVRMYMLDGKFLFAAKRSSESDFRSNFSLGGKAKVFEPTEDMIKIAKTVCTAYDPMFIGVDFTFKDGKPLLNEVEDVVGTRMIYKLSDIPVHELFLSKIFHRIGDHH